MFSFLCMQILDFLANLVYNLVVCQQCFFHLYSLIFTLYQLLRMYLFQLLNLCKFSMWLCNWIKCKQFFPLFDFFQNLYKSLELVHLVNNKIVFPFEVHTLLSEWLTMFQKRLHLFVLAVEFLHVKTFVFSRTHEILK